MHKKNMSSKRPSTKGKAAPTTSRREMENALLLAHASCDVSGCTATDSVAKAICRFWSGLETDARRSLTSEKKHVVLQTLRKKHLHTRNCPCCQHSKVFFDGGARTYERFCTAWEAQPDDAGLIDIHSPAILGTDENADKPKAKKKEAKKASKPRPRGKRTILDELEERENRIRELEEREREAEAELSPSRPSAEEKEEDVIYVDVPTIFGDALSVKAGVISLKNSEIARDDLWEFLLERERECQDKNKRHYKNCEICSSYHVFELFLLHSFFDKVKQAQVDEIRRQHAEDCAKRLLEEERNRKTSKKTTSKAKKRKERRNRKEACACVCHDDLPNPVTEAAQDGMDREASNETSEEETIANDVYDEEATAVDDDEEEDGKSSQDEATSICSTEEDEEEEEEEERVQHEHKKQQIRDDGEGWTKQTGRKKSKRPARHEQQPAHPTKAGFGAAAQPPAVVPIGYPQPNLSGPKEETQPKLFPAQNLKRQTPFSIPTTEKHRKQENGDRLCLNLLHGHQPSTSTEQSAIHSHNYTLAPKLEPTIKSAPIPAPVVTTKQTTAAAPIGSGPPPPHFPYWSRHHHNVIPKNWVWKVKKEDPSEEAKALARAKALEEERQKQEHREVVRNAASVLLAAIRGTSASGDVSFMKELIKEINDEANTKFCCDCAFDKESNPDKLGEWGWTDCRGEGCSSCYTHFAGPSLFSLDPVLFPFAHHQPASSPPSSSPSMMEMTPMGQYDDFYATSLPRGGDRALWLN